jgi:Polysaccharide deacetylase
MGIRRSKQVIADALDLFGVGTFGLWIQRLIYGPHIRSIGYHSVQPEEAEMFERQIQWYSKHFVNVGRQELEDLLAGRARGWKRPGILLTFDDGTRTHFDTVAPILEKYGFTGWFFVPSGLLNLGPEDPDDEFSRDGTRGRNLTIDQLKSLAERHVIGSHGVTHIRLAESVPDDKLGYEIRESRSQLKKILDRDVDIFSWIGGEEWAYCETASELVRNNYRFAFMGNSDVILPSTDPYQLSRSNIEAYFPLSLVRLQLSGLVDLYFMPRRRRVLRTTGRLPESPLPSSL